ncbi:MAG: hypothetical protein F9K16_13435 [Thermoanaerobaculia bacterium]|nr:MAG: hypothetical protein F9K16_13435 [Thermoanaerobaculia bacterium]
MFRTVLVAALCVLALPRTTLAAWGEVDTGFSAGGWMNLWSNVWAPIPGALMVDTEGRIVTVAQDGTGVVKLVRTFGNGTVDTSFGFLGSASVTVWGASTVRIVRLLPSVGNGVVAVGNAEMVDGSWILVFRLHEDGSLDEQFGIDGLRLTRGGGTTFEAFASDAALNGSTSQLLEIVGWRTHPTDGVEWGLQAILDLSDGDGSLVGGSSSSLPSVSERWLRIADSGAGGPCQAILTERDGVLSVFGFAGTSPGCGDPSFTLPLTLPAAPGASLRAAGIVRANNGDFVLAAWVESGLLSKPTAFFRTVGATPNLRLTWGSQGIAWVDAGSPGQVGFRAARLHYDAATDDILSIGTEIGTGGPFGTVDRVRAARLLAANGALDPTVPTAGVTGPDNDRHHRVRDVAIVPGTLRPVAAVSTHLTDGFDVPESWVVGLRSVEDLFRDGFESGGTGTWSLTIQ